MNACVSLSVCWSRLSKPRVISMPLNPLFCDLYPDFAILQINIQQASLWGSRVGAHAGLTAAETAAQLDSPGIIEGTISMLIRRCACADTCAQAICLYSARYSDSRRVPNKDLIIDYRELGSHAGQTFFGAEFAVHVSLTPQHFCRCQGQL